MLLVIARKYNDIYYAISLPEWNLHKRKLLCIISNGIDPISFPCLNLFDEVRSYYYKDDSNLFNIIKIIYKISKTFPQQNVKTAILSNPVLVTNQYLLKRTNPQNLILIEDGSLNYGSFSPSKSKVKKLLQTILGINQDKLFSKITTTYLFHPDKASFYFGNIRKLKLNDNIYQVPDELQFLNHKKIFVGQPLYSYNYISIDDYIKLTNEIIKKCEIDYYLPHAFASDEENIDCPKLSLSDHNLTLEALASKLNLHLFSFGSTVLYSCKSINPNTISVLVKTANPNTLNYEVKFIESFCDKTIVI